MGGHDRTSEFWMLARGPSPKRPYAQEEDYNKQEVNVLDEPEFYKTTKHMGQRLNLIQQRVAQVEKLVKSKNIFEDHTKEIQVVTYEIRQWILEMTTQLDAVETSAMNSVASRESHVAAHYRSVIHSIRSRLAESTVQLKSLLELRAQTIKTQEDRRGIYSHSASSGHPFFDTQDPESGYTQNERDTLVESGHGKTQLFSTKRLQPLYYSARAEAIQNVQAMITELAQIFTRVASLVSAQEELTARIEDDMSSALYNLQQGETHLSRYLKSVSSSRTFILKIFGILIVFILVFVFVLS